MLTIVKDDNVNITNVQPVLVFGKMTTQVNGYDNLYE